MNAKAKASRSPYEQAQFRKKLCIALALAVFAIGSLKAYCIIPVLVAISIAGAVIGLDALNHALGDGPHNTLASTGQTALDMLGSLITPDNELVDMLTITINGNTLKVGSYSMQLGTIITSVNDICRNVAIMLLVTTFCISLAQGFIDGTNYDEIIMKKLIVFGMAIACIFSAQKVCTELANFGTDIVKEINASVTNDAVGYAVAIPTTGKNAGSPAYIDYDPENGESFTNNDLFVYKTLTTDGEKSDTIGDFQQEIINHTSWYAEGTVLPDIGEIGRKIGAEIQGAKYVLELAIPYFMSWVTNILVKGIIWVRAIELILMIAFSPLAFIAINGHSPIESIMRFMKQFFALCIQGAIILVTVYVCNVIRSSVLAAGFSAAADNGAITAMIDICVIMFVQAGIIARSKSIAQGLIGN